LFFAKHQKQRDFTHIETCGTRYNNWVVVVSTIYNTVLQSLYMCAVISTRGLDSDW